MKISEILSRNRPALSFEFFPPRNPESEHVLDETVGKLRRFNPDFVSVTYGAGGSTREKSLYWTTGIREKYGLNVMMHLTCIASSRRDIQDICRRLRMEGISNILALRGDPSRDLPDYRIQKDFRFAYELVEYLRETDDFSIGVAGYPEGHLDAVSLGRDIENLKRKVDAGADFIITQLFFDNRHFFDFMDRVAAAHIEIPVIPGIMPITNAGQVQRFTEMCGATVPGEIKGRIDNTEDVFRVGVDYAIEQCKELLDFGVPGLHFYTLNRNRATEEILAGIGKVLERE
ncbi:MAG TPA: methylenetetrahydrofolate reductase [NAD(P)H] [Proteobacteria bacterium]|nr:5,10-methylenetetrahydrofolate reductase [bacterium BMS3Abin14]HDL53006.1 methylenetetrahydrofolate reductase [NAD(P)H] [Pseudomonadota bacterium]